MKTADCTKNSDVAEKTVVRFDSPLHHAAVRFDSLLHHAAVRFDSPLHHAAKIFDSPLHHAAGSQTLILITPHI
jgi:hypothetical protein